MMYRDEAGRWRCSEHRRFRAPDSHDGERKAYDHLMSKHQQLAEVAGRAEIIPATARNVKRLEREARRDRIAAANNARAAELRGLADAEALEQLEQLKAER